METRKRVLGFHALRHNRFVKIYQQEIEIVDDESTISIEMKLTPASLIRTGMIELSEEKIILIYTHYTSRCEL